MIDFSTSFHSRARIRLARDTAQLALILSDKKGLPLAILCRMLFPNRFAKVPERIGVVVRDRAPVVDSFAAIPDPSCLAFLNDSVS